MKQQKPTWLILCLLLFTACSPEYIPNMVNSPLLSNQGEVQATIAGGTSNLDVQTAVALSDNWALMVNGSYADEHSDSSEDFHKHLMVEMGVGYYEKMGRIGRYEIFGGYGAGKIKGRYDEAVFDAPYTEASFNKIFLQPGIGLSTGYYDGSFATRFSAIQMDLDASTAGFTDDFHLFFEPVITNKFGSRYIKVIMQAGLSLPISQTELHYDYQPFLFHVGIHMNIGRKFED
ncbi:MAG: hypothetical protein R6U66_03650 [Bacteroidales bacterium]